ncbi:uncharacterized protein TNCT_159411 [Trichonephila clavata]|uniref:Uncharacterized protein n=1 Tax=Trichonephila clavata TaxID=2740835 RepID=A0A8X6HW44_TRICU|nr:uncharacterized protein TNCT_159411 [Trichonephila clavata]
MSRLAFSPLCLILVFFALIHAGPVIPSPNQIPFGRPEEIIESPKPYEFGFQMDDGNGTVQHRQETANENGSVKGKYGYVDPNGTYREVEYNADENGYHVKILSNEPGITNQNSADVVYVVKGSRSV